MNLRLSERLRQARLDAGLTQAKLAEATGRTQAYISKFERGQLRLDVSDFIILTRELEIDASDLLQELAELPPDIKVIPRYAPPPLPPLPPEATKWSGKQFLEWMGSVKASTDEPKRTKKPASRRVKGKAKPR